MVTLDGEKFRALWAAHWPNQREFAAAANVSPDTVVSGDKSRSLRLDSITAMLEALAKKTQRPVDELRRELVVTKADRKQTESGRLPGAHKIRIISKGSAGTGAREYDVDLMNEEHVPGAIYPYPTRDPVAFRVDGPSMAWNGRESLEDGDIVIFCNEHEEPIPDNSLVVAHLLDDDAQYVKRVRYVDADRLELLSQNPRFDPIPVRRDRVRLRRVKVIISRLYLGHQDG